MANPFAQYAAKPVQEPAVEQQSDNPFQQYAPKPAPTGQQKVSELGIPLPPVKEPEPIGRLESAGGSFMRGFGSIVASLPKAVGEGAVALANKFGDDPIWGNPEGLTPEDTASYKAGNAIDRWFNRFAVNPEYNEEFTSQLASGAGSMAGFLAGGFAGRAAKVPALVTTMGLGAAATGVEGVDDYLSTLSDDEQADPEMRENAFALNAALGTSEGLPVSRILNRLDTMSGGGIKAILKEGVKGGLEELTQEVLQSVGQNAIASELLEYDKNRNLFTGTVEAGEVGFTLGFLLNTLAASIGSRRARRGAEPAAEEGEIELPDIDPAAEQSIDAIGDVIELPDITAKDIEQAAPAPETAEGTQDQTGPAPGVGGEELAAEPITEEIEPVPEVNYFDNRLKRDIYRNRLQNVADELVEGGGIALVPDLNFVGGESDVRDAQGRPQAPMVRTPSLNPEWFQNLMSDSNYSMSVKKVQNAVTKAIAGDRLGVRQARVIGAMLDNIHGERMDSLAYAREQLNIAREARAKAQLPVADDWLFEEQEYPDDFDGLSRTFTELHDQAKNMDAALADEVEALMESQMDDAAVLDAITKKFEEYNGRKITTSTEAYTQPEGAAEIPGAGAEPIAGIPAAEGIPAGIPAGDQLARAEPVPAERQLAEPVPAQPPAAPVEVPVAKKAPGKKQVKAKVPRETIKAQPSEGVTPEEKTILTQERRRKKQPGRKVDRRLKGREERRKAWAYRKDVEEMTEAERKAAIEELRHDAMINDLTGLGSRLAWEQVEKKAFIAAIDADSLKYVNDTLGNKAGDELLVKIGKALKAEFGKDAYHISGDEFWVHSDSMDDLVISLGAVQNKLKTETATGPGGTITGLGFSYGVAETENAADREMKADKKTRQKEGLRVERGERPAGVVLKGEKTAEKVKKEPEKKTDLAGKVDEKAQAKKDAEVAAKKEQAKKEEKAEKYAGPPDLLTGGELEPDLFAPSKKETKKAVDKAAHEAATSPENSKPEPTEAQKEYGNYKKGVIDSSVLPWLKGLKIMIENPAGSKRRPEWKALANHYGYFQSTEAYDADEVDVFLGPDLAQEPEFVHVVDQVHPDTGKPDEHKVMLGFKDEAAAKSAYMANYQKGWKGFSRIQSYPYADFKDKLTSGFFKNSTPARKLQKQPVKAKKPAKRAEPEEKYTEYNGLNISYEVETEDTGETFTVTVDAGVAMREVDARLTALKALRDCL